MNALLRAIRSTATLGGSLLLLGAGCGDGRCSYNDITYADGATFPSADGCNTCSCRGGAVACTEKACALTWYRTCGDPVCGPGGHRVDPNVPACTAEKVGDPCPTLGARCDLDDPCNIDLLCATTDPTRQPGGCPISRARHKRDIHYLDAAERARLGRDVLDLPLATWRYRASGADGPTRLGFLIDDVGHGSAVSPDGEAVDLYGYTSMAVAALQDQARQIAELRAEVRALKDRVASRPPARVSPDRRTRR